MLVLLTYMMFFNCKRKHLSWSARIDKIIILMHSIINILLEMYFLIKFSNNTDKQIVEINAKYNHKKLFTYILYITRIY